MSEPICKCGHGKAAHEGHTCASEHEEPTYCSQGCGCKAFEKRDVVEAIAVVLTHYHEEGVFAALRRDVLVEAQEEILYLRGLVVRALRTVGNHEGNRHG